ncbi:M23 family metallopeptidase [Shimia thalassica]|uniref:M23 family metallopeptidase n=1 Tax=Shimia thalassica TaxID=1715693 RepID=UPI0024959AD5|nr:M23 family metallopeptidase [Shimia thalassica]
MKQTVLAILGSLVAVSAAGEPSFTQPVDCELGETCYIQNYVDRDPGPAHLDVACDSLTYNGHKGTDFTMSGNLDINTYFRGFDVLAAADGVVRGVRNTMKDKANPTDTVDVSGKECGNGVVIDHGDGWETQYCHMKYQSVRVKQGQTVKASDVLGQVGLSGRTEFRHLHFSVRKDGKVVDPFDADNTGTCTSDLRQLWDTPIPHVPTGLIAVGIDDEVPPYDDISALPISDKNWQGQPKALVIWAFGFGSDAGDILHMNVNGPKGTLFETSVVLKKEQARYSRAYGKKRPSQGWPAGNYVGTATLQRQGQAVAQKEVRFTLD